MKDVNSHANCSQNIFMTEQIIIIINNLSKTHEDEFKSYKFFTKIINEII